MRQASSFLVGAALLVAVGCGAVPPGAQSDASGSRTASPIVSPVATVSTLASCAMGGGPDARTGASAAYDAAAHEIVLFGGDTIVNGGIQATAQTWIWNGSMWSLYMGSGPSARAYAAMAYDGARGEVVLYGGQYDIAGASPINLFDSWVWDGSTWVSVTPTLTPKLHQPVGTFDAARSAFIVFGIGANGPETWLWNGTQWKMANPTHSPSVRLGEGMAFVSKPAEVILFGGYASSLGYLNDTWLWDGADWSNPTLSVGPSARISPTLVSGPQVLLLGGGGSRGALGDAWIWDGSHWNQVNSAHAPPARRAAAGVSDGQYLLILGGDGAGVRSDAWRWDGSDWKQC